MVPELCYFYGIHIYVYYSDHLPPHIHAIYAEHEAQVRIADGAVLKGSLPRRANKLIGEWLSHHRDEVAGAWAKAQARTNPGKIAPLP